MSNFREEVLVVGSVISATAIVFSIIYIFFSAKISLDEAVYCRFMARAATFAAIAEIENRPLSARARAELERSTMTGMPANVRRLSHGNAVYPLDSAISEGIRIGRSLVDSPHVALPSVGPAVAVLCFRRFHPRVNKFQEIRAERCAAYATAYASAAMLRIGRGATLEDANRAAKIHIRDRFRIIATIGGIIPRGVQDGWNRRYLTDMGAGYEFATAFTDCAMD